MQRTVTSFAQDDQGDWVATLDCGHRQHIRHRPPFDVRPWILDAKEREARLGTTRDCPLCDERGGEIACYAPYVCAECGALLDDGGHRSGCSQA